MPEHLRALVAILLLAAPIFYVARPLACPAASTAEDFGRRRNLWFALTLVAFLAHNFWIFMIFAAVLLLFALPQESNKLALFYLVLFALPAISAEIPGLGLMEHFFAIDYLRLLALAVLLPAFLWLRSQPQSEAFGRLLPDKLLGAFLALLFVLRLPHETFTEALRGGVFYAFTDVFLPYYVASRSLRRLAQFRDALMAFALAAALLAAIGVVEFAKGWLLYRPLAVALDTPWGYGAYLSRGENLRAQASTGQAIPLGYVMAVAIGLFLYLRSLVASPVLRRLALGLLAAGLIAPLSRGPWVGAALIVVVFLATGPAVAKRFAKAGLLGVAVVPGLLASPAGQALAEYLPFVGSVEAENVVYRQRLLEISLDVVRQNPLFGAYDYLQLPVMQQLKQGQGIIDVVNTYLEVLLESGAVGLALFAGFFIAVTFGIVAAMRTLADRQDERYLLGRALLATLLGILLIIFTVSSISVIPVIYWSIAGVGVAYARMLCRAPPR